MQLRAAHPAVDDAMNETVKLPLELSQATDSLIQNLLASEAFLTYHQSLAKMKSDSQACALLDQLSALQTGLRHKQKSNSVTPSDLDELRTAQAQVQANAVIMEYAQSQQDAVNFLREINQEISQLLGVDFAALAKQSTC
jgi:cell fate (sporulation/competence/biofilm development) regulator YlbF (YheA/YmcA/DUF963 family)